MKNKVNREKLEILKKRISNVREIEKFSLKICIDEDSDEEQEYICAYVYPSDYAYEQMEGIRGDEVTDIAVYFNLNCIFDRKCRWLGRNNHVSKVIMTNDSEDSCFES